MQQTIAAKDPETLPLDVFGTVICDEVQRFAAKTLFAAVELWPARYRVGISADESRKDKKEFLTYDLFGDVAADIKRDDLIISGNVLDVEVRIVETDFRFPRYAETKDFNELLEGMRTDEPRNQIILDLARAEAEPRTTMLRPLTPTRTLRQPLQPAEHELQERAPPWEQDGQGREALRGCEARDAERRHPSRCGNRASDRSGVGHPGDRAEHLWDPGGFEQASRGSDSRAHSAVHLRRPGRKTRSFTTCSIATCSAFNTWRT